MLCFVIQETFLFWSRMTEEEALPRGQGLRQGWTLPRLRLTQLPLILSHLCYEPWGSCCNLGQPPAADNFLLAPEVGPLRGCQSLLSAPTLPLWGGGGGVSSGHSWPPRIRQKNQELPLPRPSSPLSPLPSTLPPSPSAQPDS